MNLEKFIEHQSNYLKQLAREGELQDSDIDNVVKAIKAFANSRGLGHQVNWKRPS